MALVRTDSQHYSNIASSIRSKLNTEASYSPGQMAAAISGIETPALETLSASQNGTYTPANGKNGFSQVTVAVPSPTLVAKTITQNGSYSPANDSADGYSAVTVSVSGGTVDTRTLLASWDFTGATPLVDSVGGKTLTNLSVTFSGDGAYFAPCPDHAYGLSSGPRLYISLGDLLGSGTLGGCDIEVDVGPWRKWSLKNSDAGRFLMFNEADGLAFRHSGNPTTSGWNIYDGSWTNANIIGTTVDYSTTKLSLAAGAGEYDTVYVNGFLLFADTRTGRRLADNAQFMALGGTTNSNDPTPWTGVGGITIKALRLYRRPE